MHESIVRTEEQVLKHIEKLEALADNKNEEIAKINYALSILLGNFYANEALSPQKYIDERISKYESLAKGDKLGVDICLWLTGKFNNAPFYNPLKEEQFSTEQVLEDFGKTNYTEFNIG